MDSVRSTRSLWHNICPYTCGVCNERRYWTLNIFHRPLHMFPQCLQSIVHALRSLVSAHSLQVPSAALIAGIYLRSLLSCINRGDMDFYNTVFFIFVILTIICAILTAITLAMDYNTLLINQWQYLLRYHKNATTLVVIIGAFTGVGLVSIHRLLLKPLRVTLGSIITSLSFSAMLSYLIILAALGWLVFGDPHFINTLLMFSSYIRMLQQLLLC